MAWMYPLMNFWSKHSRIISAIIIVLVAALAFWLRVQQYLNVVGSGIASVYPEAKLDELDTFFNYWVVSYLDKHGLLSLPTLTNNNPATCIFWFPSCRNIFATELQGHIITIYLLYEAFKSFGVSLYDLMALLPPIFGALATIFIALLVNEVTNSKVASIVSALMYALMFVSREVAGFTVKYTFGLFTAPLVVWLHIRALKYNRYTDFVLAGIAAAYAASVWTGAALSFTPIYLSLVIWPLFSYAKPEGELRKSIIGFFIEAIIASTVILLMPVYRGSRAIIPLAFYIALLFPVAFYILRRFVEKKALRIYTWSLAGLVALGVMLIILSNIVPGVLEAILKVVPIAGKMLLALGIKVPGLPETVAEYQPLHEIGLIPHMVLTIVVAVLFLIPIAIYNAVRRKDLLLATITLWILLAWYATYHLSYFVDYMRIVTAVTVGMTLGALLTFASPRTVKFGRVVRFKVSFLQVVTIVLVIAIAFASTYIAYAEKDAYFSSYTMISRAEGFWYPTTVWLETLRFIKENTSTRSLIISWWDYGYWISPIGNRSTVADGATIDSRKIQLLAEFFTSFYNGNATSFNKAIYILPKLGACMVDEVYVLIFAHVDVYVNDEAKSVYVAFTAPGGLSFGDMAKFISAITYLGTGKNPLSLPTRTIASIPVPNYYGYYYDLSANDWVVIKSINIGGNTYPINVGLNWNSSKVLNATMPRLYAYAVTNVLSKLYPGYQIKIVPWVLDYEFTLQGMTLVISTSLFDGTFERYGLYATTTQVNQSLYNLAFVGLSQKAPLSQQVDKAYRVVLIALLKLSEEVHKQICSATQ